jgi:hypothetical protein
MGSITSRMGSSGLDILNVTAIHVTIPQGRLPLGSAMTKAMNSTSVCSIPPPAPLLFAGLLPIIK